MYGRVTLFALSLTFLLTGCGTSQHPDYTVLKGVPSTQSSSLKQAIKKSGITGLELPTKLPFNVTKIWTTGTGVPHHIEIALTGGSPTHYYDIQAIQVGKNPSGKNPFDQNKITIVMDHKQLTKLSDGTYAEYGYNKSVTKLAWVENKVLYTVSSGKSGSFPGHQKDMTEKQLLQTAESFN